ncbi:MULTISPECIES: UPF0149 family protein [Undibacterium]|jgi:uncharacterized protein|uniref:UPF0149 family protein n=1 Tax=Undibacterium umbellatum TaxID=2762300 RepID=A0ABR6Z4I8_9BURK|nr:MULTISPECIES: UPF0149 family protein [Undibacterium]MBC3906459.1 UPF0149 family protein [Undibacterium umbellatum]MDP1980898.1 UPF0149 family protein [Undibacterium sp.]
MHLDEPLSDKEFNELDKFLMSEKVGDDGMTMDALHGYLTAIALGPEVIPMAEWLPLVWGLPDQGEPKFKNEKEMQRVTGLVARFMNEIQITFEVAPQEYEPLFCVMEQNGKELIDGETWAWGFWEGMQLREEAWEAAWESEEIGPLLQPIYLLGAEEIEESELKFVDTPEKCHELALTLEASIPTIRRFWAPLRKSGVTTVKREAPKVGRNDPCPCGSGKKYKVCCGAEPTLH